MPRATNVLSKDIVDGSFVSNEFERFKSYLDK